ncbi:hypothetical protein RHMOL_Rhmol08G0199800 [Rhododendron molle]|uniref:Uncharacterized protein n=1 Tax=Rhododendron molle TaxID=49168 RepID=A0ACC0MQG5_RHOML|nr:hypothetical protein RHMOL_Rhmol08G0199800 [Rhododendron molle]
MAVEAVKSMATLLQRAQLFLSMCGTKPMIQMHGPILRSSSQSSSSLMEKSSLLILEGAILRSFHLGRDEGYVPG